ncbi:hypothetical protein [Solibacillus sp. FSL K6-1523]|uniref:hypothetical protein n=1 Tax=Solibacillus sp. FSL K6-1523 TaxID=2921471 RepID=UPI0030F5EFD1
MAREIPVIITVFLLSIHINNYQADAEKPDAPNEQLDYKLIYDTLSTTLIPLLRKKLLIITAILNNLRILKF